MIAGRSVSASCARASSRGASGGELMQARQSLRHHDGVAKAHHLRRAGVRWLVAARKLDGLREEAHLEVECESFPPVR